jgi:hypothetical protein
MYSGDNWVFDQFKAQIAGDAQTNSFRLKQYDISRHSSTLLGLYLSNGLNRFALGSLCSKAEGI